MGQTHVPRKTSDPWGFCVPLRLVLVNTAPAWVASQKALPCPGGPPVTCVFLFITQECVLRTWGHSPTPLLMQEPPHTPTLTGPGLPHGAGPLSPAGHPNTPVYLRASAQDGSAPDFWPPLLTPALTPLLCCPPAHPPPSEIQCPQGAWRRVGGGEQFLPPPQLCRCLAFCSGTAWSVG